MSVREQIESLESVSNPLLNSLNSLPFCAPCIVLGALDVDPGRTAVATIAAACDTRVT